MLGGAAVYTHPLVKSSSSSNNQIRTAPSHVAKIISTGKVEEHGPGSTYVNENCPIATKKEPFRNILLWAFLLIHRYPLGFLGHGGACARAI